MNAILMSIKANRCKLIASGKQTVEIRKTAPVKIGLPFKVYMYEAKGNLRWKEHIALSAFEYDGRGAVVGEFVCKVIHNTDAPGAFGILAKRACMTTRELSDYLKGKPGFAYEISELKIYDNPKALDVFGRASAPQDWHYIDELKGE